MKYTFHDPLRQDKARRSGRTGWSRSNRKALRGRGFTPQATEGRMNHVTEEARQRALEKRQRPGWPLRVNDRREDRTKELSA